MTILKKYLETGEMVSADKPISPETVEQYTAQYNPQYAQGYLQALIDFEVQLDGLIWRNIGESTRMLSSRAISSGKMIKFQKQQIDLIEKLRQLGIDLPKPNAKPDF